MDASRALNKCHARRLGRGETTCREMISLSRERVYGGGEQRREMKRAASERSGRARARARHGQTARRRRARNLGSANGRTALRSEVAPSSRDKENVCTRLA